MKLRRKITLLFSLTFLVVLGLSLSGVYYFSSLYRRQEFLEILKDKTITTLRLLVKIKQDDRELLRVFDDDVVNTLYEEKVLLFDSTGHLIYSSVDDTRILFPEEVVKRLKAGEDEITYTEGEFDVYAHIIREKGAEYYAIGKAHDRYGKSKLEFLGYILLGIFIVSTLIVYFLVYYISRQLTRPITRLTREIENITPNNLRKVHVPANNDETTLLANGFNNTLARLEQSFTYQKNLVHHISHELKTPIAVLISNMERNIGETDIDKIRESLSFQRNGLMQMAGIINALLEISKYEALTDAGFTEELHIPDLLFECAEELHLVIPGARVDFALDNSVKETGELVITGSERMLKIAFFNLLKNAVEYSDDQRVRIDITTAKNEITIRFTNNGMVLTGAEQKRLFDHFFRAGNSRQITGIGLGLVMVRKIIELHNGTVGYFVTDPGMNCFQVNISTM